MTKTDCTFTQNDLGKNLYTKKTYYTVMIEQHVIADNKDQADEMFLEHGGIDHSAVNNIAEDGMGVETTVCDANYTDSSNTEYLGKVVHDEDNEYAVEDGDVVIDPYADEVSSPMKDLEQNITLDARDQHLMRQDLTKATGGK